MEGTVEDRILPDEEKEMPKIFSRKFVMDHGVERGKAIALEIVDWLPPSASAQDDTWRLSSTPKPFNLDDFMCRYTWPCAAVLAQFLCFHRSDLVGKSVLEISAGTGLPAIVAVKVGANPVFVSEMDTDSLQCCLQNAQRNHVSLRGMPLEWGKVKHAMLDLPPFDVVLASDLLFSSDHFDKVFFTVSWFLRRQSAAVCYTTYQVRDEDWNVLIMELCRKWELRLTVHSLSDFRADTPSVGGTDLPGSFHQEIRLFELTRLAGMMSRRRQSMVQVDSSDDEDEVQILSRRSSLRASVRSDRGDWPAGPSAAPLSPVAPVKRTRSGAKPVTPPKRRSAPVPVTPEVQLISPGPSQNLRSQRPSQASSSSRLSLGERCREELVELKQLYGEDDQHGVRIQVHQPSGATTVTVDIRPVLDPSVRSYTLQLVSSRTRQPESVRSLKQLPPLRAQIEFTANTARLAVHCIWMNKEHLKRLKAEMTKAFKVHCGNQPMGAALGFLEKDGVKQSGVMVHKRICYSKPDLATIPPDHIRFDDLDLIRNLYKKAEHQRSMLDKAPDLAGHGAFDCVICLSHNSIMGAVVFGCGHYFCQVCLKQDFSLKIKENRIPALRCLAEQCNGHVSIEMVKLMVDRETFQRYCDLTTDNLVDGPSFVRCPKKNCNVPMEIDGNGVPDVRCPTCRHKFCSTCKAKPHPNQPCLTDAEKKEIRDLFNKADAQGKRVLEDRYGKENVQFALQDAESEEWINKNAKPCPKCKTPIQKIDGCNKMTCTAKGCHTYFCWLCGQALTGPNPYQHFNEGNCANRLHEGDVGGANFLADLMWAAGAGPPPHLVGYPFNEEDSDDDDFSDFDSDGDEFDFGLPPDYDDYEYDELDGMEDMFGPMMFFPPPAEQFYDLPVYGDLEVFDDEAVEEEQEVEGYDGEEPDSDWDDDPGFGIAEPNVDDDDDMDDLIDDTDSDHDDFF